MYLRIDKFLERFSWYLLSSISFRSSAFRWASCLIVPPQCVEKRFIHFIGRVWILEVQRVFYSIKWVRAVTVYLILSYQLLVKYRTFVRVKHKSKSWRVLNQLSGDILNIPYFLFVPYLNLKVYTTFDSTNLNF